MIPTRSQILEKINEAIQQSLSPIDVVNGWLVEIKCPSKDIEKILDDLNSYPHA